MVVGSIGKPQHESFRKCPNACTWSLTVSLKQFCYFFFPVCLTFHANTVALMLDFSHYVHCKLGVQFESFSNSRTADFNKHPSLLKLVKIIVKKILYNRSFSFFFSFSFSFYFPISLFLSFSFSFSSFFSLSLFFLF